MSEATHFLRAVAGFVLLAALSAEAQTESISFEGHRFHPTRILAKFKNGETTQTRAVTTSLNSLNAVMKESLDLVPGLVVLEDPGPSVALKTTAAAPRDQQARRLLDRIAKLQNSGLFEYVEPDYIVTGDLEPSDAAYTDGSLWALRNRGLNQNGGYSGVDIGASLAWNITTGSTNVIVAVIDSGIRYTHQDLSRNMWRNPGEIAGNGIDDDKDGYVDNVFGINAITGSGNPMDDDSHGTLVAGTIGAAANNGIAMVGVAWTVRLMACKFLGADNQGKISDSVKCIAFATQKGARIINASYGSLDYSQAESDAIKKARAAGILFITSAGNDGGDNDVTPHYPSGYPLDNIISVAAIDKYDNLGSFGAGGSSNFGRNTVHLLAPGVSIYSCFNSSDQSYGIGSGTSAAAPFVTGVAALFLARYPDSSYSLVRDQILNTAVPVPALRDNTVTGGRVHAFNALTSRSVASVLSTSFEALEGYAPFSDLAGQNGWVAEGSGGNAVDPAPSTALGQRARIGREPPNDGDSGLTVSAPINFTPARSQTVKFSVSMSITSSTNGKNDKFRWIFFSGAGSPLFTLEMDTATSRFNYILQDNTNAAVTARTFSRTVFQQLAVTMDPAQNRWSATLDGALIATNQPISTLGAPWTLGSIAASWRVANTSAPGNNYMLFDNYRVEVLEAMLPPVITTQPQPQSQTLFAGEKAAFKVTADLSIPSSYQWQRQDASTNWINLSGQTGSSLTLSNTLSGDRGAYRVVISNGGGEVISETARLKIFASSEFILREVAPQADGSVRIQADVAPGFTYILETSEDLAAWTELKRAFSAGDKLEFIDSNGKSSRPRFYRLQLVWE